MANHRKRARSSAAVVAGATAGMTAVLAFGHVAEATADVTAIGVGGWRNSDSKRVDKKFDGKYLPGNDGFVAPDKFEGVKYSASLPIDPSVRDGLPELRQLVEKVNGKKVIVGYSEGSIVAEKYKRELDAQENLNTETISFVFIAAPTVPNGGIYARFPNLGPLSLLGFTSTGAAEPSPYDETFITIEYDPVGDFPAYANPLSLANALAGLLYLHGDPTPDAANLNDATAIIKTPVTKDGGGNDTYILVKTEHLPLLRPIRDVSTALHTEAFTEPVLGAIEPTLKLGVDMGYTDRTYAHPDTPTRFSLITPPERIAETLKQLPGAIQQGADNFKGGSPATTPPATTSPAPTPPATTPATADHSAAKKGVPKVVETKDENNDQAETPKKPVKRTPAQRRDDVRNTVSDVAKNVRDSFKSGPKSEPNSGPKHRAKPQRASDSDKAA